MKLTRLNTSEQNNFNVAVRRHLCSVQYAKDLSMLEISLLDPIFGILKIFAWPRLEAAKLNGMNQQHYCTYKPATDPCFGGHFLTF